jgi:hypothetical protein
MYSSIGGLPSEYRWYDIKALNVRQILLSDMSAIERSKSQSRMQDTVSLLNEFTDWAEYDIWKLTCGDAIYILAYLRKTCYTESHLTMTWDCYAHAIKNARGTIFREHSDKDDRWLMRNKMKKSKCGTKNTNLVYANKYKYVPIIPKWSALDIPSDCHVPTLYDIHLIEEYSDSNEKDWLKYKKFADVIACIDGSTIEEKLELFAVKHSAKFVRDVNKFYANAYHGIELRYELDCAECGNKPQMVKRLGTHDVLPNITEKSVMNMQFNIMQAMNIQVTEDTPIKKLLYWHSVYQKNAAERKQKELANKAKRRSGR